MLNNFKNQSCIVETRNELINEIYFNGNIQINNDLLLSAVVNDL